MKECIIKFKNGDLNFLRERILEDKSKEHFASLLAKTEYIDGLYIVNVITIKILNQDDYTSQSLTHLSLEKKYMYKLLAEVQNRYDVDTVIDVHTHPFCEKKVSFSSVDDNDEENFSSWLKSTIDDINFGSIVFSQEEYSARLWVAPNLKKTPLVAKIKTQLEWESITCSQDVKSQVSLDENLLNNQGMFHRSTLALGLSTMRTIVGQQTITLIGVGGIGSIVAEHLVHMGFHKINLIDHDQLEYSNLNRFVGGTFKDAKESAYKVDVVKNHIKGINPEIEVGVFREKIDTPTMERIVALSDWIIVSTDNHSSRFVAQQMSLKYFVPLISIGVNITIEDGIIQDISGEVITARVGDRICLNCLQRIHPIKIASETHPNEEVRNLIIQKGYVSGMDVKEPAVKTLNTMLATIAIDVLINQYTERQKHEPILVYEDNNSKCIYPDRISVERRNKDCFHCCV